jgi:hypothetical protein
MADDLRSRAARATALTEALGDCSRGVAG